MAPQPRLLVNAVDAKAINIPDSSWLLYARSSLWEQEGGYRTITWKQFANAVNRTAFWLDDNLPRTKSDRQTFAYLGPNDARYYILIVAAAKSKRRFFIPDGRMTPDGLANILKEIECCAWISTQGQFNEVQGYKTLVFPSLEDILAEERDPSLPYPYNETWEQAKDEIVCIIHTSGTTGVPKPIYLRNGYMSVWDSWNNIFSRHHPRKVTYRHMINARTLIACPPQWSAGLAVSLNAAVFIGITTVMLPPDMNMTPLDRQAIMNICKHTGAESIITPPSLIEDFHTDEAAFDFLKNLKYVSWIGAGLNHQVGEELAQHTNLFPVLGSTERGASLSFESDDSSMWKSYEFVPEIGHRFELVADETYELYVDRTPDSSVFQSCFYTFPHLNTISTEELYSPTFDKNGTKRWISRGRKDDLVKLSWLAKFHAIHIEDAIARHPQVTAVVVGGEGRDVPYIIIEPRDWTRVGDPHKFVDEIYDTVIYGINEKDNDEIRIPREMVMLSDPEVPFKRTMKMTIMRKEVERMYENHINTLYLKSGTKRWNGGAVNGRKEGIEV